jgi:hypothetical protein
MAKPFTISTPLGFRFVRRGITFLVSDSDGEIDAERTFRGLSGKVEQEVRVSIDQWLQGNDSCTQRFHGFIEQGYRLCFTFRWKVKRLRHRMYGFLCNPKPESDHSFRLCVLIYHTVKTEWNTDTTILDRINRLQMDVRVTEAIRISYPEYRGYTSWTKQ